MIPSTFDWTQIGDGRERISGSFPISWIAKRKSFTLWEILKSHIMSIDIFTIDKRGVGMSRWPDPIMANNDHTLNIIERYKNKIKIVNHPANKGKGAAMAYGLSESEGRIIIFCDAHLKGLKQFNLMSLVFPLMYGSARTVLGVSIPEKLSPSIVNVAPFLILTGQWAFFTKDLLPLLNEIESLGYGVETLAGMQGFIPKEAILLFRKSSMEIIKAA
jgi:hypothetical protein